MVKKLSVIVLVSMLSGCASIFGSSDQYVKFSSEPKGATVTIDGQERGETPLTIRLQAEAEHRVTYSLEDYRDISFVVERKTNPWIWANFLSLGVGFIVDFATGKAYELEHEEYHSNFPRARGDRDKDRNKERDKDPKKDRNKERDKKPKHKPSDRRESERE